MKNYIKIMLMVISISFAIGCDFDDDFNPPNYVTFEEGPLDVEVELNGSSSFDVTVYTANIVDSDRNYEVVVDDSSSLSGEAFSVPTTVSVPGGTNEGLLTIGISDIDINPLGETLVLRLLPENGLSVGSPVILNVSQLCPYPDFLINFEFDGYASETTWEIRDPEEKVVFEGGGFEDGLATASVKRCLSPGEYTFTVYDEYGDGLTYPEEGRVTLLYSGEEITSIPGDFGPEATVSFVLE